MMEIVFYLLLVISFATFFGALFRDKMQAIFLHIVSTAFFFITAASSVTVDIVAGNSVIPYGGNAIVGLIALGFGVVSVGMGINKLPELFD